MKYKLLKTNQLHDHTKAGSCLTTTIIKLKDFREGIKLFNLGT